MLSSKINNSNIKFIKEKFKLIINLCEKNNINLICVRAPYPITRMDATSRDYASVVFTDLLKENKVPFFDFNYYGNTCYYNSNFTDHHHLNSTGATKVSKQLGNILKTRTHNNVYKK